MFDDDMPFDIENDVTENEVTGGNVGYESIPPPEVRYGHPGFLDEPVSDLDAPTSFVPATQKIAKLLQDRATNVRSGQSVPISRDMPVWRTTSQLHESAMRPINWAVRNLWTERAKVLVAAEQKVGKTFLVCSIAQAVSTGSPLFECDKFEVMQQGPVGIVAGEDDEGEIGRRLDRMFRARGMLMTNAPIHFLPAHNIRLNRERDQDFMRRSVRDMGLKLVIYDPLARLMDGDENSKEIVSAVLNPASALAKDENCTVMVVHHLGKQNTENPKTAIARVRGSSDITSWFSCGLFVSGNLRLGRITVEVVQRTSGNVPNEFPVDVRESEEHSVYGLGSMRLVADLDQDGRAGGGRNENVINSAADEILQLVRTKATSGVTLSEIQVHLGYGRALTSAALKKLIREDRVVRFEECEDIPDKKILLPVLAPPIVVPDNVQSPVDPDRQLALYDQDCS